MSSAGSRRRSAPEPEPGDEWVTVGTVSGPHGVRGEVKVIPQTDRPGGLAEVAEVTLALADGAHKRVRIVGHRPYEGKGVELLTFEGYPDRTTAEALRRARLLVRADECPRLPEGSYYDWQILGLRVVTTDGRELGVVEEVLRTGGNDVYVTRECLLPATAEVIKAIDLEAGRMVVEAVPGLLD